MGMTLLAMISATEEAVSRARNGEGPTYIEAMTYRMSLHTTADDPTVYRDEKEVEPWEKRCPIRRFEIYLKNKGLLTPDTIQEITTSCEEEVLKARDKFYSMPSANPGEIFDHLYGSIPEELKQQREEYRNRLKDKGADYE